MANTAGNNGQPQPIGATAVAKFEGVPIEDYPAGRQSRQQRHHQQHSDPAIGASNLSSNPAYILVGNEITSNLTNNNNSSIPHPGIESSVPPQYPDTASISASASVSASVSVSTNGAIATGGLASFDELTSLRRENARLKHQLHRERSMCRGQEEALNKVRSSAEEITLLEAEEIARLEVELDRSMEEKEHWQRRCKAAEKRVEQLRLQVRRPCIITSSIFIHEMRRHSLAS
jgi:hypothetical protein